MYVVALLIIFSLNLPACVKSVGVAAGAEAFANSVASGVEGVIVRKVVEKCPYVTNLIH